MYGASSAAGMLKRSGTMQRAPEEVVAEIDPEICECCVENRTDKCQTAARVLAHPTHTRPRCWEAALVLNRGKTGKRTLFPLQIHCYF